MHIKNGKNVYKFGFGQSTFLPPKEVRDELVKSVKSKEYTPVQEFQS